jgi:DNA-binding transcriptional LysR family regulator
MIELTDISKYRLILHSEGAGTRRLIDEGFARSGVEVSNILEVGTCESIIELVRLGVGVGLVHDMCLPARENKAIRRLEMSEFFSFIEFSIIYKTSVLFRHRAERSWKPCLTPVTRLTPELLLMVGRIRSRRHGWSISAV